MAAGNDGVDIADRVQIMDLMARYSWAIDSGNLGDYLACFHEEGTLRHPRQDGSPGVHEGRAAIEAFIAPGFANRATQTYGHQHQFNAVRMSADGDDVKVDAYAMVFRHEFHRQYWPRGVSWRMGTWHARMRSSRDGWKIADLDVRMWTDTAFDTGGALVDRGPGMPGVRD